MLGEELEIRLIENPNSDESKTNGLKFPKGNLPNSRVVGLNPLEGWSSL